MFSSLFGGDVTLVNTQTRPMDGIEKISINYIAEGITILETEGDAIVLKEYFNKSEEELLAKITLANGALTIEHGERPWMSGFLRGHVELYLPKQYFGALNAKTISGKIDCPGTLVVSDLYATSTSGRLSFGRLTSGIVVLSTVSGAIDIAELRSQGNLHSTSGSIRVQHAEGAGEFATVSGSVEAQYSVVTGDLTAKSVSGRVRLGVPPLLSYQLKAQSVSGRIDVPIATGHTGINSTVSGTVGLSPQVNVTAKTTSGRIEIWPIS